MSGTDGSDLRRAAPALALGLVGASRSAVLVHTSFNWVLEHVRAYVVSVVTLLEPVGATLLAVRVLERGEVPGPATVGGGAAVLAGVWSSSRAGPGGGTTRHADERRRGAPMSGQRP